MDTFTEAYIEALLWSETDEAGNPLDAKYSIDDIAKDSLEGIIKECAKFQVLNAPFLFPLYCEIDDNGQEYMPEQAGHDFALNRNRHGSGFWDRFMRTPELDTIARKLSDASHEFGEANLYVGDDQKLHIS